MSTQGRGRGYVRTGISRRETIISCVILMLIAGIGVAIYIKGQIYDPGLFSLNLAALKNRSQMVQVDRPASQKEAGAIKPPGTAEHATSPASPFEGLAPEGWKPLGDLAEFDPGSLYEKIDGRAEQYLDYKCVRLTCGSFVNGKDRNQFIDIYLFDMGLPVQAFGVFSAERSEGLSPVALGREGYRVEANYFFWKGNHYVQVLASDKGEKLAKVSLDVATALGKRLKDDGEPIWGLTALPEKDRIPGTVQYFVVDAMSLDFMKDTYLALYRKEDAKIMAFLSRQPSPDAAAKTLASYEAYLKNYGKVVNRRDGDGYRLVVGDMGGTYDVVFHRGRLIGGVSMVANQSLAERAAWELLTGLRLKE